MAIGDPKLTEQINRLGKRGFTAFNQRLDRECFGRYNIVAARCDGCDSRLRCRYFAAEMSTVNGGSGRWGRMEHTEIYGRHFPGFQVNEWRKPHCNSAGLQCNGGPGEGDVCSEPGCNYDGHNSKEESLEGQTITTKGPIKGIPSCEHFPPQRIAVLVMHERMRPSMGVVKEMDKEEFKWLLESQWAQMALEKLAEWKRENGRNLPFCPEHIDLKGKMVKVENRAWLRELWLVCPGTGIKRGV